MPSSLPQVPGNGPRALVHCSQLSAGGGQASVLRLVHLLCEKGWQVELVTESDGGEFADRVDARASHTALRGAGSQGPTRGLWRTLRDPPHGPGPLARKLTERLRHRINSWRLSRRHFDVAMVGKTSLAPTLCCRQVRADKRWVWVRTDVAELPERSSTIHCITRHQDRVDAYLCVSRRVRESLIQRFPHLEARAELVYNVLDPAEMERLAEAPLPPLPDLGQLPRVVTVGRLDDGPKGVFRMLEVHRRLRDEGLDFHWLLVGDGPDRDALRARVEQYGMGARFHLLGAHPNPFPFYRAADLVAVPSQREGLCGVINEAKVLGLPVLATRVGGVEEQLVDGVDGLLVENQESAIGAGLRRLLTSPELRRRLSTTGLPPALMDDDAKEARLRALLAPGGRG